MKRFLFPLVLLALCGAVSLHAQPNPEANKLARAGTDAAKNSDFDTAIENLRKATDMDRKYAPNLAAVFQQRAAETIKQNRFPDAIADLDAAIKAHANPSAFEQRAYVYMRMNDFDHALADYSEAIKANPNEPRLYSYRAHMLANKNDFKGVIADCDKILKAKKGDPDAQALKKWAEDRMKSQAAGSPAPQ
jgi:tetratricopeptide (TPR) repeat protein